MDRLAWDTVNAPRALSRLEERKSGSRRFSDDLAKNGLGLNNRAGEPRIVGTKGNRSHGDTADVPLDSPVDGLEFDENETARFRA